MPAAATSKHASPAKKSRLAAPAIVETTLAPGIDTPCLASLRRMRSSYCTAQPQGAYPPAVGSAVGRARCCLAGALLCICCLVKRRDVEKKIPLPPAFHCVVSVINLMPGEENQARAWLEVNPTASLPRNRPFRNSLKDLPYPSAMQQPAERTPHSLVIFDGGALQLPPDN